MNESAIYEFGSKVYCSDADCGELLQFVVEPDVPRLIDLVVCSVFDGAARLVAPDMARVLPYGILLGCDKSAFDHLPATPVRGAGHPAVMRAVPDAQTRIRRGDHVQALDGDAGRVLGLVVRTEDERSPTSCSPPGTSGTASMWRSRWTTSQGSDSPDWTCC